MTKAMKEVLEKMGGRMLKIGEEEKMDEGDEEKSVEIENGDGGVSSPDMDEMADFGFHQQSPSQHDTAFHKVSRRQADKDFLMALKEQAEEEVK